MAKAGKHFYAVFKGRKPGIYEIWPGPDGAQTQVTGFLGAKYKKFKTREEAREWMDEMEKNSSAELPGVNTQQGPSRKKAKKKTKKRPRKKSESSSAPEIKKPRNEKNLPEVTMYTDGACTNNPGPGGYGVVLIYKGREKELSGGFRLTTNNRMEITACVEGLKALKKPCAVTLFSDSKYVVDAIEKGWAKRWKAKGWMRTKEEKAKNADLWKQMLELCETHDVCFKWVKGHAGNEYNERCDRLAVEAAAKPDLPADAAYEQGPDKLGAEIEKENISTDLECPECGASMTLRNSKYGLFYGCSRFPECDATHGARPDGRPLGVPADSETKKWRMKAHDAFDALWKSGDMKRNDAYRWLAEKMDMDRDECQIGRFDKEQCRAVVEICEKGDTP